MKIVFLDIDGVCNSQDHWPQGILCEPADATAIDPATMAHVNDICVMGDAWIVVTSVRRMVLSAMDLRAMFRSRGCQGTILDKTPNGGPTRGDQIARWLVAAGPRVSGYVILDDEAVTGHDGHLVRIDPTRGLQADDVPRALAVLSSR